MMKRPFSCLLAVLCLTGTVLVQGLAAKTCAASKLEKDLRETRKKIQAEQMAIEELKRKSRNLLGALEDLDKDIDAAEEKHRASRSSLAELRKENRRLKEELRALEEKIGAQRNEQGRRLVAYYRLGRSGMLPLVFSDASPPEKIRNLDAMKGILLADWQRLEAFHELLQEKERVKTGLEERLKAEEVLHEKLRDRKRILQVKRQEKRSLLSRIEQDKKLHERMLRELGESAKALERKLKDASRAPAVAVGGPLGAQKGKLPWPVTGKVYRKFEALGAVRSKGIDIKTDAGTPVRAVWSGGVVYADWFRGYGKLVIVHHGEKDYTVVAHLSRLAKRKGERVETGEILGDAGDTGSMEGCLVHFEIWHAGRAKDPLKWLRGGGGANGSGGRGGSD